MAKKKIRTETWWTIKAPFGGYFIKHFSLTRREAIQEFMKNDITGSTWKDERKLGYNAVKVLVTEAKKR